MISRNFQYSLRVVAQRFKLSRGILVRATLAERSAESESRALLEDSTRFTSESTENLKANIYIISNRPRLARRVKRYIGLEEVVVIDGAHATSFSNLCNSVLRIDPNSISVIVGDKCFPSLGELNQMIGMIRGGLGLVGIYRFGCFGVHPSFLHSVGYFDENFEGGGFEDVDMLLRSFEADVAIRLYEATRYFPLPSSWNPNKAEKYYKDKWITSKDHPPKRRDISSTNLEEKHEFLDKQHVLKGFSYSRLMPSSAGAGLDSYL